VIVADGKVISSRTCHHAKRENCFIAAHDAKTGREVWKFYVTAAQSGLASSWWPKEISGVTPAIPAITPRNSRPAHWTAEIPEAAVNIGQYDVRGLASRAVSARPDSAVRAQRGA
jgi:hypothetical protein